MNQLFDYFNRPPQKIRIPEIKEYLHYLLHERKLAANSVNGDLAAIRFFYRNILHRYWYVDAVPQIKRPSIIPVNLSEEEVADMINNINSVFYKAVLMLMYSSGLRQGELRNLKVTDIDSKRNLINVRNGKGRKDRQTLLSPLALKAMRTYWRLYRSKNPTKSDYLFIPNKNSYNGELKKSLSHTSIAYITKKSKEVAGIKKKLLLTRFATHSLSIS